ncbi:unnamed protein product [Leptidea sinapis]|uniref:Uncharacterized protein n=1 Tax=Leptidea sinapis TaxID=189913 RepID=A0A5E4R2N7_9NEOP|nr:unnamed protein product [Leptidea sinapis]
MYPNAIAVQVDVQHRNCSQFSISHKSVQQGYPKTAVDSLLPTFKTDNEHVTMDTEKIYIKQELPDV